MDRQDREFVNTAESRVIDPTVSAEMPDPDADAAAQLPRFRAADDGWIAKREKRPEIDLGEGRSGYKGVGGGQTDAVRECALVGKHQIVLVAIFGLDGVDAPSGIARLLDSRRTTCRVRCEVTGQAWRHSAQVPNTVRWP